eukprot:tig00020610_g12057.t1
MAAAASAAAGPAPAEPTAAPAAGEGPAEDGASERDRLAELASTAERWKREVAQLRRESGELAVKLTKAEVENAGLHRALDSCNRDIRALNLRVASLSAYQQQAEAYGYGPAPAAPPSQHGSHGASPSPAPGDRIALQAQVDDLTAQLVESSGEVRRLKARLQALASGGQRANADLSARLEAICDEKIEVEQRLASAEFDVAMLKEALGRAQREQAAAVEGSRVLGALLAAKDLEARAWAAQCEELRGAGGAPLDPAARHLCAGCQGRHAAALAAAAPPLPAGLAAGWEAPPRPLASSSPQAGSLPFSPAGTALGGAPAPIGPFSLASPLRSPPASPLRTPLSAMPSPFFGSLGGPFSAPFGPDAKAVGGGGSPLRNPSGPPC